MAERRLRGETFSEWPTIWTERRFGRTRPPFRENCGQPPTSPFTDQNQFLATQRMRDPPSAMIAAMEAIAHADIITLLMMVMEEKTRLKVANLDLFIPLVRGPRSGTCEAETAAGEA